MTSTSLQCDRNADSSSSSKHQFSRSSSTLPWWIASSTLASSLPYRCTKIAAVHRITKIAFFLLHRPKISSRFMQNRSVESFLCRLITSSSLSPAVNSFLCSTSSSPAPLSLSLSLSLSWEIAVESKEFSDLQRGNVSRNFLLYFETLQFRSSSLLRFLVARVMRFLKDFSDGIWVCSCSRSVFLSLLAF